MEAKAQACYVRVTPQKSRRVVNEIRGMRALAAVDLLTYAPQAVAKDVKKVLESALANARYAADAAGEKFVDGDFVVSAAYVDEGPTMKRIQPRAQGRANRILKRTSHITVVVSNGTKSEKKGA
ncbi:50S ribosomal protein L22 [Arcanobacterium canis]